MIYCFVRTKPSVSGLDAWLLFSKTAHETMIKVFPDIAAKIAEPYDAKVNRNITVNGLDGVSMVVNANAPQGTEPDTKKE